MKNYEVKEIPISDIYSDDTFNCRGAISHLDITNLSLSIKSQGLQFPITVQPRNDVKTFMPEGKQYRIIAGHRRYKACTVLGMKTIPAMIKENLDEIHARILNLSENFDRSDLNILQESHAIKCLYEAGLARETVGKELNKSTSWVQVRFNLLSLPEEIQQEAAAGLLNQYQIKALYSLDTKEEQFEAVKSIKNAKISGKKLDFIGKRRKQKLNIKRPRKREELFQMIEHLIKSVGAGLTTRALAWSSGEITTEEFFADMKKEDPTFIPPVEF